MICDECGRETQCTTLEWIGTATIQKDTYTTGTQTGPAIVTQTAYAGAIPVETHLCHTCFLPRARKCCRGWWLRVVGLLGVALSLLAISYNIWFWIFFVPGNQVQEIPAWQIIVGVVCGLAGLISIKFFWNELWLFHLSPRNTVVVELVHKDFAVRKAKALDRDAVFTREHYEAMQRFTL